MERTKEELLNCIIQINNQNHSNRILKFFQEHGYFLKTKVNWKCPKNMVGAYIGPAVHYSSDIVHMFYPNCILGKTAIKLPSKSRRKFPREMWVSNNKTHWCKRDIFAKIKTTHPFIAADPCDQWVCRGWKYAKEIK